MIGTVQVFNKRYGYGCIKTDAGEYFFRTEGVTADISTGDSVLFDIDSRGKVKGVRKNE